MSSRTQGQLRRGGKFRPEPESPPDVRRACSGPGGRPRSEARPFARGGSRLSVEVVGGSGPPSGCLSATCCASSLTRTLVSGHAPCVPSGSRTHHLTRSYRVELTRRERFFLKRVR